MATINAEKFFELVSWFNNFSEQINQLYNKMSGVFWKELKLKETTRYANFSPKKPYISDILYMGFLSGEGHSIDVMFLLNKEGITNVNYEVIPSIIIAKIEGGTGYFDNNAYWKLFSDENSSIRRMEDGRIIGKIALKGKDCNFSAIQIDLEAFNNRNIDEILGKEILPKVKEL